MGAVAGDQAEDPHYMVVAVVVEAVLIATVEDVVEIMVGILDSSPNHQLPSSNRGRIRVGGGETDLGRLLTMISMMVHPRKRDLMHIYSAPKDMDLHYPECFILGIMITSSYHRTIRERVVPIVIGLHQTNIWRIGGI